MLIKKKNYYTSNYYFYAPEKLHIISKAVIVYYFFIFLFYYFIIRLKTIIFIYLLNLKIDYFSEKPLFAFHYINAKWTAGGLIFNFTQDSKIKHLMILGMFIGMENNTATCLKFNKKSWRYIAERVTTDLKYTIVTDKNDSNLIINSVFSFRTFNYHNGDTYIG